MVFALFRQLAPRSGAFYFVGRSDTVAMLPRGVSFGFFQLASLPNFLPRCFSDGPKDVFLCLSTNFPFK